jgi:hypothetical protein
LTAALLAGGASVLAIAPRVQVLPHPLAPRVDVTIDARPLASYLYLTAMPRPALVSLHAANGTRITQDPESDGGGRVAGFWFAHGNVNGIDFSEARLVHRRVVEAYSSDTQGRLAVQTAWTAADGSTLVLDDTSFTFAGTERERVVDRVTRLAAVNGPVRLGATTRALVGLQLAGGFDPDEAVSDAQGDRTSPCAEGRGRWIAIPGVLAGQSTTVALFDHPGNAGSPNVVRCRADALELAPGGDMQIEAGASVTFRYRLVIVDGRATAAEIERRFREFGG